MEKEQLIFTIQVNTSPEKVWDVLWTANTYNQWTKVFNEGSHAVSDWNEGSEVLFLGNTGDGMYSRIEKKIVPAEMSILHLGEIKNGVRVTSDWGEAYERYFLAAKNGGTELRVVLDSVPEFSDYFNETFPKALAVVKTLSEN
ncbi:MAG: SRPBCC domain-containing protein [Bacteroidota bacterium]